MKIQTIKIGEANESLAADRKSILLMSTPHCGKTTHIEGIMNFIFGVNFEDDFRLFLSRDNAVETSDDVSDDDASDDNGTGVDEVDDHNHDDWIKVYQFDEFEGGRITFPLTIIDIPRLGSLTSGTKKLYKRIQFVMNSVCREINLVCLVAKGCDFEMSEEQLNYFSSILELFKDHLMSNFCAFYTFADAGKAHVAEIFQANEITPVESFHVNWSSLCQSNDSYSSTFWEMNSKQLGLFFDFLKQSSAKSIFKDLPTSQKREEIKCEISLLQPKVTEGLVKLGEVKFQIKTFTDYKADILSSGDISYTIEEIRQNKTDLLAGHHVTNCINCYFTCHEDCTIPDDKDKINCWAMTDGYCRICSMHCIWSDHKNTPYIYEYVAVKVTKSYQELKMNYEKEKGEQLTYEEYLNHLERDIEKLLERLHDNIKKISEGRNELQGIKHSPLACSVDETIEDMIASEMLKHETGFERRIQMYKELQQYSSSGMVRISRN
ncbi:uncharacterized protein LOC134258212 [Saccostrea cucullata]|uniref:uncharacterized protein LOC134258212 n=1 Tax=Saccostrea cuccullata TaxID=36930 RepID=UPI002ED11B33